MLEEKNLICILAKAIWRNENFIKNFPHDLMRKYFDSAINMIVDNTPRRLNLSEKIFALEFIMAVFRLRELANPVINNYLK